MSGLRTKLKDTVGSLSHRGPHRPFPHRDEIVGTDVTEVDVLGRSRPPVLVDIRDAIELYRRGWPGVLVAQPLDPEPENSSE